MAQKEVCPRDEIADPPGAKLFPIREMDFVEGFVSFRKLCGVQPSPLRFDRKRTSPLLYGVVRYRRRHGERPYPSDLKRSAQVRQRDSYRSYSQGDDEGV